MLSLHVLVFLVFLVFLVQIFRLLVRSNKAELAALDSRMSTRIDTMERRAALLLAAFFVPRFFWRLRTQYPRP